MLLTELNVPIVLDADGLNALALKPDVVANRKSNCDAPLILTPHPGEAARLLGTSIPEIESNRIKSVRELAQKYGAIALLKGRYTLISDPDGRVWINTTGNPGMASGGMGDTLTGIIGGLLAQSIPRATNMDHLGDLECRAARIAACAGAYLHGFAGDMAAQQNGEAGVTAGDVIHKLPAAVRALQI
jgi:NAD(P)H-hydrate epimerase